MQGLLSLDQVIVAALIAEFRTLHPDYLLSKSFILTDSPAETVDRIMEALRKYELT
jgi:hypothetical protein